MASKLIRLKDGILVEIESTGTGVSAIAGGVADKVDTAPRHWVLPEIGTAFCLSPNGVRILGKGEQYFAFAHPVWLQG